MDSHFRSIVKALSWRVLATLITVLAALLVTGQLGFAAKIGAVDFVVKCVVYYVHERVWDNVSFGRTKSPEYQI